MISDQRDVKAQRKPLPGEQEQHVEEQMNDIFR